jgi:hypothetical protein
MAFEPKHENLVSIIEKGHLKVQSDKNFREVLIYINMFLFFQQNRFQS